MALTAIEETRLLVGDTDSSNQILTDAQVQHFLDEHGGNPDAAAVAAARAIAAKFATLADMTTGKMSVAYSRRAEVYLRLADSLESTLAASSGVPYLGGVSVSDMDGYRQDSDIDQPAFSRDTHEDLAIEPPDPRCP